MQHLDCGTHKRTLENEALFDKAAQEQAEQLEGQAMVVLVVSTVSRSLKHTTHGLGTQATCYMED